MPSSREHIESIVEEEAGQLTLEERTRLADRLWKLLAQKIAWLEGHGLASRHEEFDELTHLIDMGRLNVISLVLMDLQGYINSPKSQTDRPQQIIGHVLDLIIARRDEIANQTTEGGGSE